MVERWLPFWEPQLVVACAIALQLSLSEQVTVGPNWLLPALEGALLIGLVIVSPHPNVRHFAAPAPGGDRDDRPASARPTSSRSSCSATSCCTARKENGHQLILSGIVLWCTNVLLFGLWYWEIDRGGPAARAGGTSGDYPDFLFPQMTDPRWAPQGLDAQADRLPVRFAHERDRVQPHRHDAADADRQVADERAVARRR